MAESWSVRHGALIWAAAILLPPLVAGVLTAFRPPMDGVHASLVLVLVVVAICLGGRRAASLVAAVIAGLAYNFFWTQPYLTLLIDDPGDIATMILLVLAGLAVGNLSWWAQRQQAVATRRAGYLDDLRAAAEPSSDEAAEARIDALRTALATVLGVDTVRYESGRGRTSSVLNPDGTVTRHGRAYDVDRLGLPTDDTITIEVAGDGSPAHFSVHAASRIVRPTLEQRQVAVLLASYAGAHRGVPA